MHVSLPRRAASLRALRHDGCVCLLRVPFEKWRCLPFFPFGASSFLSCRVGRVPSSASASTLETLLRAFLFLLRELGYSSGLDSVGAKKTSVCMGKNRTISPSNAIGGERSEPVNSTYKT